jgi:hypothetical protein
MKKIKYSTFLILLFCAFIVKAQDETPNSPNGGSQKMIFPGYAVTMYQYNNTPGLGATHNFTPVGIGVFPLIKINDRLFLDCQVGFAANSDGSTSTGIGELVGYYKINPYMSAFFGNFTPHYGVYLGILDDFTNRFGTGVAPVGMGHGLQNQNGVGIQGGLQCGYSKFTYQLYAANGPQLIIDTTNGNPGNQTGMLDYGSYTDNNKNKSIGWHVGFLPFSNSSLELTFSGEEVPKTGPQGDPNLQNINATSMAFGLNYYHTFNPIMVRLIAEYNTIKVSNYDYPWITDSTGTIKPFNNMQNGWFAGMTFRATGSSNNFIKNLELAGRLGAYTPPKDAPWGGQPTNQTTVTLTYWLSWDIPLSFEYDILTQSGSPTQQIFSTILFFRF